MIIANRDLFPDNDRSTAAALLGTKGGAAKTDAKRRTAAENGKKGGRPKKS